MCILVILCVSGVACIAYFVMYLLLVGLTNTFTWFWLLLGLFCLGGSFVVAWMGRHLIFLPAWLIRAGLAVAGICVLVFLAALGVIVGYGWSEPEKGADYVIVLGARVSGMRPTYNLEQRLEKAYRYLTDSPSSVAILSGGQGRGEHASEASVMRDWLMERGIRTDRLILEDQSVNTDQNLAFSMEKMGTVDASVVIVSNRFHIFRSLRIARRKGLKNVQGLGAPVKWYTAPNMYVREGFAVLKYAICGQI